MIVQVTVCCAVLCCGRFRTGSASVENGLCVRLASSDFERSAAENEVSLTETTPKALSLKRRLLQNSDYFVPFPSVDRDRDLPVVSPVPGCIRQTSVGLCILPREQPEEVLIFAEEQLDAQTAFTIGILLDLGVTFTIDDDGITFRLPNRVSCDITTSVSQLSVYVQC